MQITPIKTAKILPKQKKLTEIIDEVIVEFKEESILVITSKIVALCEGSVVPLESINKQDLIASEADYYLPATTNRYNVVLTIKDNVLIPSAGIDESNVRDHYVLWPKDAQKTANNIRSYLQKRFKLKKVGVLITDSKTTPLRWGTTGVSIAHSGFAALNSYIGKPDIFGRLLKMTKANIADGLAVASVLVMGEGAEQTPLAAVENVPFVEFQMRNPTKKELDELSIRIEDDLYAEVLRSVKWKKGANKRTGGLRGD